MVRKKVWVLYQFHARIMGRLLMMMMMMMIIFASDKMRLSFCSEVWKCTALLQQIDSSPLVSKASIPPILEFSTTTPKMVSAKPMGSPCDQWAVTELRRKPLNLDLFRFVNAPKLANHHLPYENCHLGGVPHSIFLDPFVCRRNAERRI